MVRMVRVHGPSMVPTLRDGDRVLADFDAAPSAGDVALVRWASRPDGLSVKRLRERLADGWFVVGDNTFGSTDSRDLGAAEALAVVRWRLWPRPGSVA